MSDIDILETRKEFSLTQQQFANLIGIDKRTVINWEKGKLIPESKVILINMLLEKKRNSSTPSIEDVEKINMKSVETLNREILELKDHIKTLKSLVDEKNKVNAMLEEKLQRLT